MSNFSRRKLIASGLAAGAGASGLALAARLADKYGLIPPDAGGIYGPGETLTYATQRLFTGNSLVREFPRGEISKNPFANGRPPRDDAFKRFQDGNFADWRLTIGGMVSRPASFSLNQLRDLPSISQITHLACEEGWSFIAEWTGVPLAHVLKLAGAAPQARYVVYQSFQRNWFHSIDIAEAFHPQTLVTYGMNGADLPIGHGGPLRLRVPRQLGYKSVKYLTRLTVTDSLANFGKVYRYAWYAGI